MRSGGFAASRAANQGTANDRALAARAQRAIADAVPQRAPWFFGIVLVLVVADVLLFGLLPREEAETFRFLDAAMVAVVAIGPAELVLLVFAWDRLAALVRAETEAAGESPFPPAKMIGLGILLIGTPASLVLWANEGLDRSPVVMQTLVAERKWVATHRRSPNTYEVSVTPDLHPPSSAFTLYGDGTHAVVLPRAEWERVMPGRSTLTLATHRGLFGFAWMWPVAVNP